MAPFGKQVALINLTAFLPTVKSALQGHQPNAEAITLLLNPCVASSTVAYQTVMKITSL